MSYPGFRAFLCLTTALVPWSAYGQGSISQSGVAVPADFACWLANGILADCGVSSLNPAVLPVLPNGDLLGNATGSSHQAQDTTLSALIDTLGSATRGDILYRGVSGWVFLAPGTSGLFLQSQGASDPVWATAPGTAYTAGAGLTLSGAAFSLTSPVAVALGGTGLTLGVSGGVLGYTATGVLASSALLAAHSVTLGGGAGATPYALSTLGSAGQVLTSGGAGVDPAWSAATTYLAGGGLTLTGTTFSITAPVTVARGGTGLTSGVSGGIPGYTASGNITSSALLTQHGVMLGGGAGLTPSALTGLGTSGQALLSNGAAADPSFQTITNGTVTQLNSGHCLTGGPITATGTIAAIDAASGVCGAVTPDTNALHFVNGAGAWVAPLVAGTHIDFTSGTVSALGYPLTGTTGSIGGASLAAGGCSTGTVAIVGATTAMAVALNPVTYPGDAAYWKGYVSSAGTVTVANCIVSAGTPAASIFAVRVIQ